MENIISLSEKDIKISRVGNKFQLDLKNCDKGCEFEIIFDESAIKELNSQIARLRIQKREATKIQELIGRCD